MRHGALVLLLVAALAQAAGQPRPRPFEELSDDELASQREHVEHRLLLMQQRRFEAANRGDDAGAQRASRKFRRSRRDLDAVLRETERRRRL